FCSLYSFPTRRSSDLKVNELARALGEGEGFRKQKTFSAKDSKVDIVAWKGHSDQRSSQIVLFGQCAGGANALGTKLEELDPEVLDRKSTRLNSSHEWI